MITWNLEIDGVTKTPAEWPAQALQVRTQNMGIDLLTFNTVRRKFDDPDFCDFGDIARLFRVDSATSTSVKWFEGRRLVVPAQASPSDESQAYTFANAWEWLETNIFQQPWFGGVFTSHIIVIGSVGFNLKVVLDYAIAQGCPIAYVQGDLDLLLVTPPANEVTGKTCAGVITDLLQFAPDTVTYFDYTTSPATIRFRQRPALTAIPLRTADSAQALGTKVQGLRIVSREDLRVPSVKICFETLQTVNGQQRLIPDVDIYPPGATGREDGALSDTIILQGANVTTVEASLLCETIVTSDLNWWKKVAPILADPRIKPGTLQLVPNSLTRVGADGAPSLGFARWIIEGQAEDWMINPDNSAVDWQEEVIQARFSYEIHEQQAPQSDVTKIRFEVAQLVTVNLTATNAPTGETFYNSIATIEEGDPPVIGLAQYLYGSLNPLHYEAGFQLLEEEVSFAIRVGHVCNLFGSARTALETMRALVQGAVYSIDDGLTSVSCGPPRHLSITDILALLRANRLRRRWTNPDTQTDGTISAGNVILGRGMPNTNSIAGPSTPKYLALKEAASQQAIIFNAETPNGHINVRLVDCNGKTLTVREVAVCVAGVEQRMMVIGSAPYV